MTDLVNTEVQIDLGVIYNLKDVFYIITILIVIFYSIYCKIPTICLKIQ